MVRASEWCDERSRGTGLDKVHDRETFFLRLTSERFNKS